MLDDKTVAMVRGWVENYGGDRERAARWMQRWIKAPIRECRALVDVAMGGANA